MTYFKNSFYYNIKSVIKGIQSFFTYSFMLNHPCLSFIFIVFILLICNLQKMNIRFYQLSYQENDTWNHEIFVKGFVIVCLGCFPFSHILSFSFHFSQFLSISKSAYPEKNFSHTIYVESFDIRIR